ncbi:E3 ubiquitin protein ligase [Aphelenchoides besseyi]|nr:E3 ubiquitin protein ligase [Aphelenchoides besseyi]KAI6193721.1 E3 ubiquitin protein ligase [Aphelenchoides besseyi]
MNNQDDAPVAKRARMVVFEPIRLPSVYNVKALNSTILPAQYYKLTERVRIKQRQIATLEKRMEELENRHSSDEELICIINQQWNQLDDIMVDLLRRFVNEGNIDEIVANKRAETNWLTILSQLNNDEINQRLSSRVNFSTEALSHLLKAMNTYSQKRERILAFLDRQRKRNNDSPETNAEDSRDALDQSQELSDENKIVDIDAALRQEIIDIAAENKRLEEQNVKWRSEKSRLRAKIAAHDEEMELMQSKVENAVNQMEDLRYELEKSAAREEKLESVIIELKKKEEMISPPETKEPSTTKEKPTENKEKTDVPGFEELQHELEMQTELAEKRLNEIQNLSTVNQQLAEKVAELDMSIKYLPTSVISNSPDYMCLKFKYSQLLDEAKRVDQNNQELLKHVVDLRKCYEDQLRSMKDEFNTGMQRMQENCTTMTTELLSVKKECAQMELEFKTKFEVDAIESRTYNEMKLLIDAARTDGNRKTEDMNRMKKQIVTLKAEVAKTKESLDEARKIYDTCIVIPFEDKPQAQEPDSATRSSQAAASTSTAPAPVPPPMISDKRIKIESSPSKRYETKYRPNSRTSMKPEPEDSTEQSRRQSPSIEDTSKMEIEGNDLKAKVGPIENVDQETQSKVDISAREKRLQKENEVLREKIQKYHRTEKIGGLERAKRAIQYLTEQNERLKRDLNTSSQAEGGLMKEIEMMSKAVEDLMKQNTTLTGRNAEQDTTYVRLVKDGLQSEATLRVAKQTIDTLEEKMRITENELEALRIECNTVEEKSKLLEAAKETLETNLRKTKEAMEICRRSSLNVSSDLNELKIRHEKQTLEVQELRQQLKDRAGKTEETRTKMARIREERNQLRKKLARAKQATEFDNFDQLLEAENRTLRESLACPSCKTNDKNTVLTKCFHVFCMDCIKRRYDARSRKCPKCNATFGANDYHRIYFE